MEGPCGDENYKFSQNFEEQCLDSKLVERINANWSARKVAIDPEADRKLEKNQARIEIWSFTGQKMSTINVKERGQLSETALLGTLKKYQEKNTALCAKEITRIETALKAREQADKRPTMVK
ncbi:MAG: hypothetical protein ABMA26_25560 [Limisphaerales bacterium]